MESKQENNQGNMPSEATLEKNMKLSEVTKIIKDYQGKITLSHFENTLHNLFELVPELEAIQKNARLRVFFILKYMKKRYAIIYL